MVSFNICTDFSSAIKAKAAGCSLLFANRHNHCRFFSLDARYKKSHNVTAKSE